MTLKDSSQTIATPNTSFLLADFTNAAANNISDHYKKQLKRYRHYVYSPPEKKNDGSFVESTNSERHKIKVNDRTFRALHTPAENPTELVVFFTGCKSKTAHWQDQIQQLVNEGKSVLTVNMGISSRVTGFNEDHYKMLQKVLFDKDSPVHQITQKDGLKIKLMGHSFGGHLILRALKDEQNESNWQKLAGKLEKIVLMNPFSGAKELNPNKIRGKLCRLFYFGSKSLKIKGHAVKNANKYDGECLSDILHSHVHLLRGQPKIWASNNTPTHAQVTEMEFSANKLNEKIESEGFSNTVKKFSTSFLLGDKDFMADIEPNIATANALGAKHVVMDAWHNPWHEKPAEAWKHIKEMLGQPTPEPTAQVPRYAAASAPAPARA